MRFITKHTVLFIAILGIITNPLIAQDTPAETRPLRIVLPTQPNWNIVEEGRELMFQLKAQGGKSDTVFYAIKEGKQKNMIFDSLGHFVWTPSYDLADRINTLRTLTVVFEAYNRAGESVTHPVEFKVMHVNRPAEVDELRPFYVQYNTQNTYKIDANAVRDPDSDPVVFVPVAEQMPEGMRLSSSGEITWQPSLTQFNSLKKGGARYMEFYVEDQPAKVRTKGRVKVETTQMDLPPELTVVPKMSRIRSKENSVINLKFFLADPNGDDDIAMFGFVSDNRDVPQSALVKNTTNQYEFIWTPGYDFVRDPFDSLTFNMTFYVLDKAQNRAESKMRFVIENTVNEAELDAYKYSLYRSGLVNAWGLLEQMKEKEEELKKGYRRAKKGKQNRSVLNASLGATTGLAPVIAGTKTNLKTGITTVGGTTVMTIGTLEATEVIGRSTKDLLDRFNYVMEKKSELQNKGDIFAREYSLKSARRTNDFIRKLDEFRALMSLKGLVALELDANWENKKEATDKALKRAFRDFSPLDEAQ